MKRIKPLQVSEFKVTQTPKGSQVIVPVTSLYTNPIFIVAGITVAVGLLRLWFSVDLLSVIFAAFPKEIVKAISDSVLLVVVPSLVMILESRRASINSIK